MPVVVRWLSWVITLMCILSWEAREHGVGQHAAQSTGDGSLAVENSQAPAKFKARVKQREV